MLTRAALTVFLWGLTLAVGLLTANLQHTNFVRAAELDEIKRECDVIEAAIGERRALAESREARLLDGELPSLDRRASDLEGQPSGAGTRGAAEGRGDFEE